jgi:hypothetical protein
MFPSRQQQSGVVRNSQWCYNKDMNTTQRDRIAAAATLLGAPVVTAEEARAEIAELTGLAEAAIGQMEVTTDRDERAGWAAGARQCIEQIEELHRYL